MTLTKLLIQALELVRDKFLFPFALGLTPGKTSSVLYPTRLTAYLHIFIKNGTERTTAVTPSVILPRLTQCTPGTIKIQGDSSVQRSTRPFESKKALYFRCCGALMAYRCLGTRLATRYCSRRPTGILLIFAHTAYAISLAIWPGSGTPTMDEDSRSMNTPLRASKLAT